jgi:hypothetical protein
MIVFQLFVRLFGYHISVVVKRQPDKGGVADDPNVASFLEYLDEVEKTKKPNGRMRSRRR